MKLALTGNEAAAYAIEQINPDVLAAFPITPTTQVMEILTKKKMEKKITSEIILSESEHSAMSSVISATAAGARSMTATSSQGLALMHEMLHIASGLFLPIVMIVGARALSSPINIHNDHSDVMSQSATGWIQLYAETVQEAYDNTIQAIKISENPDLQIPIMVIMDGFITTHQMTSVEVLTTSQVQKFVGSFKPIDYLLDLKNPLTIGGFAMPDQYSDVKDEQHKRIKNSKKIILSVSSEYNKLCKKGFKIIEEFGNKLAKTAIVAQASVCGTIKNALKDNKTVKLVKVNLFRPFPQKEVTEVLKDCNRVIVIDRAYSFDGIGGPLYKEIQALNLKSKIDDHVIGLGGNNISEKNILQILNDKL